MHAMSISEIAAIVGGSTTGPGDRQIVAVSHDTRSITRGSLYVAIRGELHDGHAFVAQAAERGAIAALVDRDVDKTPPGLTLIRVADTRRAMGILATHVRRQFRGKVIAVGGSNGKTSTKKLIAAVLGTRLRGSASPKSFNNDIGVPVTIFAANPVDDFLVLELGTNHPGEIALLTAIAQPDVAVITNCGAEHLEGLGDLAGVRRENAALIDGLQVGGALIVNGDDAELLEAVSRWTSKRLTFGFGAKNDLTATAVQLTFQPAAGTVFRVDSEQVFVPLLGRHNAANALVAIAVGRELGVADADIFAGLASAEPAEMRLNIIEHGGVMVLNDAYNANPDSMRAALATLADLPVRGRRIAVLGDMFELGEASAQYHGEIGRAAVAAGVDLLLCVGPRSAATARAANLETRNRPIHAKPTTAIEIPNVEEAARTIPPLLRQGDVVLVKASRSMKLERVAAAIETSRAPTRQAS